MLEKIVDLFGVRWHQSVSVRVVCISGNDLVFNAFLLVTHDDDDFLVEIWEKMSSFSCEFLSKNEKWLKLSSLLRTVISVKIYSAMDT